MAIRDRVSPVTTPPAGGKTAPPAGRGREARRHAEQPEAKPEASDAEQTAEQHAALPTNRSPRAATTVTTYRVYEFRSDEWAEFYTKRIDATIAALKSEGVPVFWVGLPSIRGTDRPRDMQYLNDLYRARAEKAGITYIDVWDGFVDDNGRFTSQGPDFEGQIRRLRAGDGVHFTKAGARKLAHYVEREIRRAHAAGPVAGGAAVEPSRRRRRSPRRHRAAGRAPARRPGGAADRIGDPGDRIARLRATPAHHVAPKSVTRVLVKGEAIAAAGRPRGRFRMAAPRASRRSAPIRWSRPRTEPMPVMKPAPQTTVGALPNAEARPAAAADPAPRAQATSQPQRSSRRGSNAAPQPAASSRSSGR